MRRVCTTAIIALPYDDGRNAGTIISVTGVPSSVVVRTIRGAQEPERERRVGMIVDFHYLVFVDIDNPLRPYDRLASQASIS